MWAALFISFGLIAWFQARVIAVAVPEFSPPVPQSEAGVVEGGIYKNSALGLELTPDPDLKLGSPEIKGKQREIPVYVTIAAWEPFKPHSAPTGLVFSAIALDYYPPDRRSTDACMRKVIEANQTNGFETVEGDSKGELGGISFARRSFFKVGPVYQTVFVRACAARVLILVFSGPDRNTVNKMISRTDLKLDLVTSGCARQR